MKKIKYSDKKSKRTCPLPRKLSALVLPEKSQILHDWVRRIKELKGSYNLVTVNELAELCGEFLESFLIALRQKDFLKLRIFIEKLSRLRSSQGFRLSEVQKAYYSFYDVIQPRIMKWDAEDKIDRNILTTIHTILIDTLFELSESYHRQMNVKIDNYIREIELLNAKFKELSITDELTGCYNYRYFQSALDTEVLRASRYVRPLSLVMFDIDYFKKVNDEYGHPAGDEVLKETGATILKSLRPSDLAFRYGGEEFAIIVPETERANTTICANRIRENINNTVFTIGKNKLNITVSGGVEGFYRDTLDKSMMVSHADSALYIAKRTGRNRVVLYSS